MSVRSGFAPATLSNLGPAIDSIAVTFGAHGVHAEDDASRPPAIVLVQPGDDTAQVLLDAPLSRAIAVVARSLGVAEHGAITLRASMPVGVGLGASAAIFAATAHALAPDGTSTERQINAAIEGERALWGHPGTHVAAAAVLGRSVVCGSHFPRRVLPLEVSPTLALTVVVPQIDWGRPRWKAAVPRQVAGMKAIEQAGRVAGLVLALQAGDVDMLHAASIDRIVLPELIGQVPGFFPVERAAREAGAVAAWITGRGPALALAAPSPAAAKAAAEAAVVAWRAHSISCLVLEGTKNAEET